MELFEGITAGVSVKLVHYLFDHMEYVELVFTPGDTSAMVRTKKPLDADKLIEVSCVRYT